MRKQIILTPSVSTFRVHWKDNGIDPVVHKRLRCAHTIFEVKFEHFPQQINHCFAVSVPILDEVAKQGMRSVCKTFAESTGTLHCSGSFACLITIKLIQVYRNRHLKLLSALEGDSDVCGRVPLQRHC